jgi:hypothetical protein
VSRFASGLAFDKNAYPLVPNQGHVKVTECADLSTISRPIVKRRRVCRSIGPAVTLRSESVEFMITVCGTSTAVSEVNVPQTAIFLARTPTSPDGNAPTPPTPTATHHIQSRAGGQNAPSAAYGHGDVPPPHSGYQQQLRYNPHAERT